MNKLYRFDQSSRWRGFIVRDQAPEAYAQRTDLTELEPQEPTNGTWPYWIDGAWQLIADPLLPLELL